MPWVGKTMDRKATRRRVAELLAGDADATAEPKRLRDWIGREVVLLHRIETRGGNIYDVGERMRVRSTWRGMFALDVIDPRDDGRGLVRQVPARWVKLVKEPKP